MGTVASVASQAVAPHSGCHRVTIITVTTKKLARAPLLKTLAHNPTQKGVVPGNTFGRAQYFVAVLLINSAHRFQADQ